MRELICPCRYRDERRDITFSVHDERGTNEMLTRVLNFGGATERNQLEIIRTRALSQSLLRRHTLYPLLLGCLLGRSLQRCLGPHRDHIRCRPHHQLDVRDRYRWKVGVDSATSWGPWSEDPFRVKLYCGHFTATATSFRRAINCQGGS